MSIFDQSLLEPQYNPEPTTPVQNPVFNRVKDIISRLDLTLPSEQPKYSNQADVDLVNSFANAKPDAASIMKYPTAVGQLSDVERYKNSSVFNDLGYIIGTDNEYRYAKNQPGTEVFANTFKRLGPGFVDTVGNYFAQYGRDIKALLNGDLDMMFDASDKSFKEEMRRSNENPIFDSPDYQSGNFMKWIPGFKGSQASYGNLFASAGFTLGTMASAALETVVINAIGLLGAPETAGISEGAAAAITATRLPKYLQSLKTIWNASKTISRGAALADDLYKLGRATNAGNRWKSLGRTALQGVREFNAAAGEAGLESSLLAGERRQDLINQYVSEKGHAPTDNDLARIEDNVMGAAKFNFMVQLPLLAATNRMNMGNLFRTYNPEKNLTKAAQNIAEHITEREGKAVTVNSLRKALPWYTKAGKAVVMTPLKYTKTNLIEGGQELAQAYTQKVAKAYYDAQYKGLKNDSLLGAMSKAFRNLNHEDFDEFWGGFIMGAPIGGVNRLMGSIRGTTKDGKAQRAAKENMYQSIADMYNSAKDNWKVETARALTDFQRHNMANQQEVDSELTKAAKAGDHFSFNLWKNKGLSDFIFTGIQTGKLDNRLADLNELKELSPEEFKLRTGLEYTPENKQTVDNYVDRVTEHSKVLTAEWRKIDDKFTNPYNPNKHSDPDKKSEEQYKYGAWEMAKRNLLFSISDAKFAIDKQNEISQSMIKDFGVSKDHLDFGFNSDARQERIEELEKSLKTFEGVPTSKDLNEQKLKIQKEKTALERLEDSPTVGNFEKYLEESTGIRIGALDIESFAERIKDLSEYNNLADFSVATINYLTKDKNFQEAQEYLLRAQLQFNDKALEELDKLSNELNKAEDKTVREFAEKVAGGEVMSSPEDIQFYENNKEAVEEALKDIQKEKEASIEEVTEEADEAPQEGQAFNFNDVDWKKSGIAITAVDIQSLKYKGPAGEGKVILEVTDMIGDVYDVEVFLKETETPVKTEENRLNPEFYNLINQIQSIVGSSKGQLVTSKDFSKEQAEELYNLVQRLLRVAPYNKNMTTVYDSKTGQHLYLDIEKDYKTNKPIALRLIRGITGHAALGIPPVYIKIFSGVDKYISFFSDFNDLDVVKELEILKRLVTSKPEVTKAVKTASTPVTGRSGLQQIIDSINNAITESELDSFIQELTNEEVAQFSKWLTTVRRKVKNREIQDKVKGKTKIVVKGKTYYYSFKKNNLAILDAKGKVLGAKSSLLPNVMRELLVSGALNTNLNQDKAEALERSLQRYEQADDETPYGVSSTDLLIQQAIDNAGSLKHNDFSLAELKSALGRKFKSTLFSNEAKTTVEDLANDDFTASDVIDFLTRFPNGIDKSFTTKDAMFLNVAMTFEEAYGISLKEKDLKALTSFIPRMEDIEASKEFDAQELDRIFTEIFSALMDTLGLYVEVSQGEFAFDDSNLLIATDEATIINTDLLQEALKDKTFRDFLYKNNYYEAYQELIANEKEKYERYKAEEDRDDDSNDPIETIRQALNEGRQVKAIIQYQGVKDSSPRSREIIPVSIQGDNMVATDVEANTNKTYKISKISKVESIEDYNPDTSNVVPIDKQVDEFVTKALSVAAQFRPSNIDLAMQIAGWREAVNEAQKELIKSLNKGSLVIYKGKEMSLAEVNDIINSILDKVVSDLENKFQYRTYTLKQGDPITLNTWAGAWFNNQGTWVHSAEFAYNEEEKILNVVDGENIFSVEDSNFISKKKPSSNFQAKDPVDQPYSNKAAFSAFRTSNDFGNAKSTSGFWDPVSKLAFNTLVWLREAYLDWNVPPSSAGIYVTVMNDSNDLPLPLNTKELDQWETMENVGLDTFRQQQRNRLTEKGITQKGRVAVITDRDGNPLYFNEDGSKIEDTTDPNYGNKNNIVLLSVPTGYKDSLMDMNTAIKNSKATQESFPSYLEEQKKKLTALRGTSQSFTFEIDYIPQGAFAKTDTKQPATNLLDRDVRLDFIDEGVSSGIVYGLIGSAQIGLWLDKVNQDDLRLVSRFADMDKPVTITTEDGAYTLSGEDRVEYLNKIFYTGPEVGIFNFYNKEGKQYIQFAVPFDNLSEEQQRVLTPTKSGMVYMNVANALEHLSLKDQKINIDRRELSVNEPFEEYVMEGEEVKVRTHPSYTHYVLSRASIYHNLEQRKYLEPYATFGSRVQAQSNDTPIVEIQEAHGPMQAVEGPSVDPRIADIERRRQEELEKYDTRDVNSIKSIDPDSNFPLFNVGQKFNQGMNLVPKNTVGADNYNPEVADNEGEGYQVITKIFSPAEVDVNGKMTKSAEVEITIFNNKKEADQAIKSKLEKVKGLVGKKQKEINTKYDAELAALTNTVPSKEVEFVTKDELIESEQNVQDAINLVFNNKETITDRIYFNGYHYVRTNVGNYYIYPDANTFTEDPIKSTPEQIKKELTSHLEYARLQEFLNRKKESGSKDSKDNSTLTNKSLKKPIRKKIDTGGFNDIVGPTKTDDDILKEAGLNRSKTSEDDLTPISQDEIDWFKKTFPKTDLNVIQDIVNSNAWATWTQSGVILYSGAAKGSLYHEAWHNFSQLYLTRREKLDIYEEVRKKGGKINAIKSGVKVRVDAKNATDFEIEEHIAEEFREYSQNQKTKEGRIFHNTIFRKIWNFLTNLFRSKNNLNRLYSTLYNSKVRQKNFNLNNAMFGSLNRDKTLEEGLGQFTNNPLRLQSQILDHMDAVMMDMIVDNKISLNLVAKNKVVREKLYMHLYNSFVDMYEQYTQFYNEEEEGIVKDNYDNISNMYGWLTDEVVFNKITDMHLQERLSMLTNSQLKSSKYSVDPSTGDIVVEFEKEETSQRAEWEQQAGNEVSSLDAAHMTTKFLVKSLPKMTKEGRYTNEWGLEETTNFSNTWKSLLNELAGISSPTEMFSVMKELANRIPEISELLRRLKADQNNLTIDDVNIQSQFWQDFARTQVPIYQTVIEADSNKTTLIRSENLAVNKVREDFRMHFELSPFKFTIRTGESRLDIPSLLEEFPFDSIKRTGIKVKNQDGLGEEFAPLTDDQVQTRLAFLNSLGFNYSSTTINSDEVQYWLKGTRIGALKDPIEIVWNKLNEINNKQTKGLRIENPIMDLSKDHKWYNDSKDKGEVRGISNVIKQLLQWEVNNSDTYYEPSAYNAENKTVYEHQLNNYQTLIFNALNDYKKYPTLWDVVAEEQFKHLNPETNSYLYYSAFLRLMFDLDTIIEGKPAGTRRKVGGKYIQAQLVNYNGLNQKNQEGEGTNLGMSTTKLSPIDKLIMDINNTLSYGVTENMRAGDKSSAFAVMMNTWSPKNLSQKVPFDIKQTQSLDEKGSAIYSPLHSVMNKYLISEALRIWENTEFTKDGKKPKSNIATYDKGAMEFTVFDSIISQDTKNTIESILAESKSKTEAIDKLEEALKKGKDLSNNTAKEFSKYFFNRAKELNNKLATSYNIKDNTILSKFSEFSLIDILKAYIVNSIVLNIEQTKIIYGDLAFYKQPFKRFSAFTATGKVPRTDKEMLDFLKSDTWRKIQRQVLAKKEGSTKGFSAPVEGNVYRSVVFADVELPSRYYERYKSLLAVKHGDKIAEQISEAYKKNFVEADAQGFCTLQWYREYKIRIGEWYPEHEVAYKKEALGLPLSDEERFYFMPAKPQYAGPLANVDFYAPVMHKFSIVPLLPSVIKGTNFEKINTRMIKQDVGYGIFESGSKIASLKNSKTGKLEPFYSDLNTRTANDDEWITNDVYWHYLKEQLNIEPKMKTENVFGTQFRKLLFQNKFNEGVPIDWSKESDADFREKKAEWFSMSKEDRKKNSKYYASYKEYHATIVGMVEKEKEDLKNEIKYTEEVIDGVPTITINDWHSLTEMIKKEVASRNLPTSLIEFFRVNDNGQLVNSLDASKNRILLENLLLAIVNSRLVSQDITGDSLVQAASTGFENSSRVSKFTDKGYSNDLKFYDLDNGVATKMEVKVALTGDFKNLLKLLGPNAQGIQTLERLNEILLEARLDSNSEEAKWLKKNESLFTMVGYRIPTQGLNSIENMIIAEFLPESQGNIIVVPSELVVKAGSDFDIDKLNVFKPSIALDEYGDPILDTKGKRGLHNKILGIADQVLSSEDSFYEMITPNSVDILKDQIADRIKEIIIKEQTARGETPEFSSSKSLTKTVEPLYILEQFEAFLGGKETLGVAALANVFTQLLQTVGMHLSSKYGQGFAAKEFLFKVPHKTVTIEGTEYIDYGSSTTLDGVLKSEIFSQFINAYVDIAKEPFIFYANATIEIAPIIFHMINAGTDIYTAMDFVNQPIIRDYVRKLKSGNSLFLKKTYPEIYAKQYKKNIQNDLFNSLGVKSFKFAEISDNNEVTMKLDDRKMSTFVRRTLVDTDRDLFSKEKLASMIGKRAKSDPKHQIAVLAQFIEFEAQARAIRNVQSVLTFDTKKSKSVIGAIFADEDFRYQTSTADTMPGHLISEVAEETVISPFRQQAFIRQLFKDAAKITNSDIMLYLLQQTLIEARSSSQESWSKIKEERFILDFKADTISFILQNGIFTGTRQTEAGEEKVEVNIWDNYNQMLYGDTALGRRLMTLKRDKADYIQDSANGIDRLMDFLIQFPDRKSNIIFIKYQGPKFTGDIMDELEQQWRNGLQSSDVQVRQFFIDLAYFSLLQSGIKRTPGTFSELIPNELYEKVANAIIAEFEGQLKQRTGDNKDSRVEQYINFFTSLFEKNNPTYFGPEATRERGARGFKEYRVGIKSYQDGQPVFAAIPSVVVRKSKETPGDWEVMEVEQDLEEVARPIEEAFQAKEVSVKRDENTTWNLRVEADGTVINLNTNKALDTERDSLLINKAHLKSKFLKYEMVQAANGVKYAVTADNRVFSMAGSSMGKELKLDSGIRRRVLERATINKGPIETPTIPIGDLNQDEEDLSAGWDEAMKSPQNVVPLQMPTKINSIGTQANFSRVSVQKDSNSLYLFTDNAARTSGKIAIPSNSWYVQKYGPANYPTMTQAVIRGLDNAYPITTMVDDKRTQWNDSRFEEYKKLIDDEIETIKKAYTDKGFTSIKFSDAMPIGKGSISNMKNSAPRIWEYLNYKLLEIGIDNRGERPASISDSDNEDLPYDDGTITTKC